MRRGASSDSSLGIPLRASPCGVGRGRVHHDDYGNLTRTARLPCLTALLAMASPAAAHRRAREDRWAAEVEPQVVVGDVEWLTTPQRARVLAIYTAASGIVKGGAVVVHGAGVHPDFGMIGALRTALPEQGIARCRCRCRCSLPMFTRGYVELLRSQASALPPPGRAARKGCDQIAIVAHSMGAAMADAYLARPDAARIEAWVVVGMLEVFKVTPRVPFLDVVAERDFVEVLAATKFRGARLRRMGAPRGSW